MFCFLKIIEFHALHFKMFKSNVTFLFHFKVAVFSFYALVTGRIVFLPESLFSFCEFATLQYVALIIFSFYLFTIFQQICQFQNHFCPKKIISLCKLDHHKPQGNNNAVYITYRFISPVSGNEHSIFPEQVLGTPL